MYPGSPFEMKTSVPEQKLGDCLVSMQVFCTSVLFLLFLPRLGSHPTPEFEYRTLFFS